MMIAPLFHSTLILFPPNVILILKLKAHVEALYFCIVPQTSSIYGIHLLDFTKVYLCLLSVSIQMQNISEDLEASLDDDTDSFVLFFSLLFGLYQNIFSMS
jgi:hypothetical protein